MKRPILFLALVLSACDLAPLEVVIGDAGSSVEAQFTAAPDPCGPCIPGYEQVHYPPHSDIWCQATGVWRSQTPCRSGTIINWSRDGLVQCLDAPYSCP